MATENYLLSLQGISGQQYVENVLCFQSAGLTTTDTLDAGNNLIQAFIAHAQTLWLACMSDGYFLSLITARRAFPKPSATAYAQYQQFTNPGIRGPTASSCNLCPVMFLVPPMGTKSGGKVFMPDCSGGSVVNNQYSAGYITATSNLFTQLLTGLAGSGTNWKLAIYSRKNTSAVLASSFGLSERIGFQGRRRKAVGA